MGQDVDEHPSVNNTGYELEDVHEFVYLGSTISDNLTLEAELNRRIGKAATTLLTEHTQAQVYMACIGLCASARKDYSTYFICVAWGASWASHRETMYPTAQWLWEQCSLPFHPPELKTSLAWRMVASPKDLLYGELAAEKRPTGLDDPSCVLKTLFLFGKNTYKTAATLQYDTYSTKITFAKKKNYI